MTNRGHTIGATIWTHAGWITLRASIALVLGALLVFGAGRLITSAASVGDRIPIQGLSSDGDGIAVWNTSPDAPEPEQSGHQTSWTSCSAFAPYYLASADFGTPDGMVPAGLRAAPMIEGMAELAMALSTNGFTERDLTMSFGPQTLGADRESHEWTYDPETGIEQRYYAGGTFILSLQGEPLVGGAMPRTTLHVAYNAIDDCMDDEVSGGTETVRPENRSSESSEAVQEVADALLTDVAEHGLRVVFESVRAVREPVTEAGRTVQVFELQSGRLEVADGCSCALGIFESDDTHRWDLRWVGPNMPADGPVRLKVVATAMDAQEGAASSLVVTAFDESAPANGTQLEVAYPAAAGDAVAWLDLDVLPNTTYSFTVRHTGSARNYKLGTSHPQLVLGHVGVRFQRGETQSWAIEAAANETVQLEVSTDALNLSEGAVQATSVTITVDGVNGDMTAESPTRTLSPGSSQMYTFTNGSTDRTLVVHTEADGHFRLTKVGGDERLYVRPCATPDAPANVLTITDGGVDATQLRIAVGDRIEIVNSSSRPHRIQSNRHPLHSDCPPLNQPGQLEPGARGFTDAFLQEGTCGFHDHLNPSLSTLQGQVVVGNGQGGSGAGGGGGGSSPYAVPSR